MEIKSFNMRRGRFDNLYWRGRYTFDDRRLTHRIEMEEIDCFIMYEEIDLSTLNCMGRCTWDDRQHSHIENHGNCLRADYSTNKTIFLFFKCDKTLKFFFPSFDICILEYIVFNRIECNPPQKKTQIPYSSKVKMEKKEFTKIKTELRKIWNRNLVSQNFIIIHISHIYVFILMWKIVVYNLYFRLALWLADMTLLNHIIFNPLCVSTMT